MSNVNPTELTQRRIKELHLKQIYLLSLRNNGISRAQLKREMGLSFPSISVLVDELIESNILEETGITAGSARGRPSMILKVRADRFAIPVVIMCSDGYVCRLFSSAAGMIECVKIPHQLQNWNVRGADDRRHPDMASLCTDLIDWINQVKETHSVSVLLLSAPGSVNEIGVLSSSSLGFVSPPGFIAYLEEKTGLTAFLGNTSDHYAYGEYHQSGNAEDFALILIGQGVGSAVLRNGKIFSGKPFRAGEFGHISIDYRGKPCVCGGRGCLERYISTDIMAQEAGVDFDLLCRKYAEGEPEIEALVNNKAQLLALGISNMLTMQPLEHIVLGGQIQKLGDKFLNTLRRHAGSIGFRKAMQKVDIQFAGLGEDAEAVGALWNYLDNQINIGSVVGCRL